MRAYNCIRPGPSYRREAFAAGLKAAGYDVQHGPPTDVQPGDVLLIWNRYDTNHHHANRVEGAGGRVLVAENGYLGKDADGHQLYAIAEGGHNGSGRWVSGDATRWDALGLPIEPMRRGGREILVCPNRSFGRPDFIMPIDWTQRTVERLAMVTDRPIRVRPHPGNWQTNPPKVRLEDDLATAHACVIWASSAGVHALRLGVPVICTAPYWILKACCPAVVEDVNDVRVGERAPAFQRLAWAQWTLAEIAAGLPFRTLLA